MLRRDDGSAVRFENGADLNEYLDVSRVILPEGTVPNRIADGTLDGAPIRQIHALAPEEELEEAWFLGLRMREGVQWSALVQQLGRENIERFRPVVDELCKLDLLYQQDGAVRLTRQGMLFSNDVFARFLGVPEAESLAV
jgi:oxygen-independent coproporphyrinogen-3 oxidase